MVARRLLGLLSTIAPLSFASGLVHDAQAQSTPASGGIQPLCISCGGPSPVSVTPASGYDSVLANGSLDSVRFTVKNTGTTYTDTYYLTLTCTSLTCPSGSNPNPAGPLSLTPGASRYVWAKFYRPSAPSTGSVKLTANDSLGAGEPSTGTWNIVGVGGPAPNVSLAPYLATNQAPEGAVIYAAAVPAIGAMGTQRSLTLVYSSAAARPTPIVTVDVTNAGTPYPSAYELQVQRADNGVFLTLLNGSTAVYYTAGTTTTTRLVAALDARANNLHVGSYPITVVVSSVYPLGTNASTVNSRLLVDDQSGSPLGAGVGLAELPRLYPDSMAGTYGLILVGASGSAVYFSRTCGTCTPFVSPPGVSATLAVYTDPQLGSLFRLAALDSSQITDFNADGTYLRDFAPAGIKRRSATWSSGLLTSLTDTSGRGFTLSYASGKLTQIADNAGRVTSVTVVGGQLVAVTTPDLLTDSLGYDGIGRLTRVKNPAGGVTTYVYSALNQLLSDSAPADSDYLHHLVRPATALTTVGLVVWQPGLAGTAGAPKGNVRPDTVMASATDPLGSVTRTAEDRFGLATKIVDPVGEVTTITRDTLGQVTQSVAPNGHKVQSQYGYGGPGFSPYQVNWTCDITQNSCHAYAYDASRRVITDSLGPQRLDYLYNGSGSAQGPAGTLKAVYAGATAHADPMTSGTLVSTHYRNAFGQDTLVLDGAGNRSRAIYGAPSAGGTLDSTFDAKGHRTKYQYNGYGLVSVTTLTTGSTLSTSYDVMGRPDTSVDALNGYTRYTYGPLGLTRVTNPAGQTYKFDLNAWGLIKARHDLGDSTKVDVMWYDVGGHLRMLNTRRGDVLTLTYDALGRMLTRSGPDFPTETFGYGLNGAWTAAANANGQDTVFYDSAGRATRLWQLMPDGSTAYQLAYTYDYYGRPTSRTAPLGGTALAWVYNPTLNVLDSVNALGAGLRLRRDVTQRPDTLVYNGAWQHWQAYDSLHLVVHDTFSVPQLTSDFAARWTYDSLGQVVSAQTPNTGFAPATYFSYDADGRLTNACQVGGSFCWNEYGGTQSAYAYDPGGNRNDPLADPLISLGNHVWRFKNYWLSYDANGSIVQKTGLGTSGMWTSTDTSVFTWNALGQLTKDSVRRGGASTVVTFAYDALGRRVAKTVGGTTTWFVYDGDRVVLDVSGVSPHPWLAEYAYNGSSDLFGMRTPSWTAVAINDPTIHTVLGLADAGSGAEIKRYGVLNMPWSQQTADTGTVVRFRMGGQEYDQETGLYHLGARYYDPQMGRFLSEDPAGIAGGLNLYAYAANDPVNAADPTGLAVSYAPPLSEPAGNGGEDPCAMAPFENGCWGNWLGGGGGDADAQAWAGFGEFTLMTEYEQNEAYQTYVDAASGLWAANQANNPKLADIDFRPMLWGQYQNAYNDVFGEVPAQFVMERREIRMSFDKGLFLVDYNRAGKMSSFDPKTFAGNPGDAWINGSLTFGWLNPGVLATGVPAWYVAHVIVHEGLHFWGASHGAQMCRDVFRLVPNSAGHGLNMGCAG